MKKPLLVALVGNPNAGKSTLFNALTGGRQRVGNWPGKTVERKTGVVRANGDQIDLVDLPGAYSLMAFSTEEEVARDFLIHERPDAVIIVADAVHLERHLYLAVQVLELGLPTVLALNMSDIAQHQGLRIDRQRLSRLLGVPVVSTAAHTGEGLRPLLKSVMTVIGKRPGTTSQAATRPLALIDYGPRVEETLTRLAAQIERHKTRHWRFPTRWLALQLLEQDETLVRQLVPVADADALLAKSRQSLAHLAQACNEDVDTLIADRRYRWINEGVEATVEKPLAHSLTRSDRVDRIMTHKVWGLPIFLAIMWTAFKLTSEASVPYLNWVDALITGPLSHWVGTLVGALGLGQTWVNSLLLDGVLAGVGGVLVFVPVLIFLYLVLALLEASGYMARAAFVMDRLMQALGLQGKSFLPMLVGFGCNVPAIYATRTLDNEKDRILTGLLVPFMSCGARLPVYVLVATIFFPAYSGSVVFGMYLLGIFTAIGVGLLLKRTLFRGTAPAALVMELPPYRFPGWKSLWSFTWARTAAFVRNAGTLILAASVVLWVLLAIPANGTGRFAEVAVDNSAFAALAAGIAPAFSPLGFGQWETSGALLAGFVAKEVVVSTLAQTYLATKPQTPMPVATLPEELTTLALGFGQATLDTLKSIPLVVGVDLFEAKESDGPTPLMAALKDGFESASQGHGALAGLAFMVFVLLYTPCIAAVAAERHELGGQWMWLSIGGQLALAWAAAFVVFQGGRLLGVG